MNTIILKNTVISAICALLMIACTESQEAKLPDGAEDNIYAISLFNNKTGQIKTSENQVRSLSEADRLRVYGESQLVKVIGSNIAGVPEVMFENLYINGELGKTYDVLFEVNNKEVLLNKLVGSQSKLTALESQLAKQVESGVIKVPVAKFEIADHGQLVKVKDSYGKDTSTLRLKSTSWNNATHIKINALNRDNLDPVLNDTEVSEKTFLVDRIDKNVMSSKELSDNLKVTTGLADSKLLMTQLKGKSLIVFEVTNVELLSTKEREALENDEKFNALYYCPSEVLSQIDKDMHEGCVIKGLMTVSVSYKIATIEENDGVKDIVLKDIDKKELTNIVQIEPNQLPTQLNDEVFVDDRNLFKVSDLQGEFLFRRTLNDTANSFPFTFPGAQGKLEIVKFVAEEKFLVVRKVDPLVKQDGSTDIDTEDIMSFPVVYVEKQTHDANGNELPTPKLEITNNNNPNAYAIVDLNLDLIPQLYSPLAYHYIGQCFSRQGNSTVTDMKQELNKGVLNFSLQGSYVVSRGMSACASRYLSDDYSLSSLEQRVFTFKERISFRKYDKNNDENRIFDMPFYAQRQFEFGVFTGTKVVPNENGNTGRDGSEQAIPSLVDFRNGKSITYTLAGLPESNAKLKSALISATRKVIDNWNKALSMAFAGSELESNRDFIKLEVAGVDAKDVHFGDLDRNFIYYVEKPVARGILGIGGASPNPRSGVVEAADVTIYGGNLKSAVEHVIRRAEAKALYDERMKIIAPPENQQKSIEVNTVLAAVEADASANSEVEAILREIELPVEKNINLTNLHGPKSIDDLHIATRVAEDIRASQLSSVLERLSKGEMDQARVVKEAVALQAIADEMADKKSALHGAEYYEAIASKHMLEALKGKIDNKSYNEIKKSLLQQEFTYEVAQAINAGHQVVERMELAASGSKGVLNKSKEEFFIEKFEAVLVHELGHNLGLTHNFEGSTDKMNFYHPGESHDSHGPRTTSSVMEYLPMDIWEGAMPGPYDVHAIRAAYTGRIEVSQAVQNAVSKKFMNGDAQLETGAGTIILNQGKYISFEQIKQLAGIDSWLDLDSRSANVIPLKKVKYCPDVEVYRFPTCNRFDHGTNAKEIAKNMVQDYLAFYEINNFAADKLNFDQWNVGGYIGYLFRTFLGVRHFMDEGLYRLFTGDSSQETIDHLLAAIEGMNLFHSVVRTPEATAGSESARFVNVKLQDGRTVPVETKWTQNISASRGDGRLRVRGIEFDKAVAMLTLSMRRIGVPDYDLAGVRMAYPDFERILMMLTGQQLTSQLQLPSIALFNELIKNNITPMAMTEAGPLSLGGSANFKTTSTELMRSIAVQSAILNLDVNTLEESDNFAALFRFGNSLGNSNIPANVDVITQLGTAIDSSTSLKFWAFDQAEASHDVTSLLIAMRHLLDSEKALAADFNRLTKVMNGLKDKAQDNDRIMASDSPTQPASEEQNLKAKLAVFLADSPDAIGLKDIEVLSGYINSQVATAKQIMEITNGNQQLIQLIANQQVRPQNDYYAKNIPIVAMIQSSLYELNSEDELLNFTLSQMFSRPRLNIEYGTIFSNVQLLNRLFYLIRPEYKN